MIQFYLHAISTITDRNDCALDVLLPTFVDFIWQKLKSNAANVFSPEENGKIALFCLVEEETEATISSTLRRVWHEIS